MDVDQPEEKGRGRRAYGQNGGNGGTGVRGWN